MAKKQKEVDFYYKMLEAKKRKKAALEQEQLAAEFQVHPERYDIPQLPPIIVKTEAEAKLDDAFSQLKDKLHKENPTPQEKMIDAFKHLQERANE